MTNSAGARVRSFAFFSSTFQAIPETDAVLGEGWTTWKEVTSAERLYVGHQQPRLPQGLGMYDSRSIETHENQIALAAEFGIDGFVYNHYWFNGRHLYQQPFELLPTMQTSTFGFALCWQNDNLTTPEGHTILPQSYSEDDDRNHMRYVAQTMQDARCIRIDGKPLFIVQNIDALPDPAATARVWREEARSRGVGEIYLAYCQNHGSTKPPQAYEFDAVIEEAPQRRIAEATFYETLETHDYLDMASAMLAAPAPNYQRFSCVVPTFDDSPLKGMNAWILLNSQPDLYKGWVAATIQRDLEQSSQTVLFVNSWNDWGNGSALEPCSVWDTRHLEAHAAGVQQGIGAPVVASEQIHDPITAAQTTGPVASNQPTGMAASIPNNLSISTPAGPTPLSFVPPASPQVNEYPVSPTPPVAQPQQMAHVANAPQPAAQPQQLSDSVAPEARVGVSVVMVTNGNPEATLQCLQGAIETCKEVGKLEFIVVDNGSTDETHSMLNQLRNEIFSVRNDTAVSPTHAWQQGLECSNGDYIVFLSNDIALRDGWFAPALMALATEPTCPAVVSRIEVGTKMMKSQPLSASFGICVVARRAVLDGVLPSDAKTVDESVVSMAALPTSTVGANA